MANRSVDMTHGSVFRHVIIFTFPLLVGNLFQQFYNLVDTMIVGKLLGAQALAAVGSTGSINFFVIGFCMGVCNGFAIPIAQLFGARDLPGLRKHVANAAWLCLGGSAVLTAATVAEAATSFSSATLSSPRSSTIASSTTSALSEAPMARGRASTAVTARTSFSRFLVARL